jgi:hypothetical protein
MTTTIQTFEPAALAALQRQYHTLRLEVAALRVMLRALQSRVGGSGLCMFIRFELDGALATTNQLGTADITDQYGPGRLHKTTTGIDVYNLANDTGTTYVFEGKDGAAGYAIYDRRTKKFYIWQMQCPD